MNTIRSLGLAALVALAAACSPKTEKAAEAPAAPALAAAPAPANDATTMGATVTEAVDPKTLNDASTARDIHNALIIPGSEALFAAEGDPPANDAAWTALQAHAKQVIDGMELMKAGSRPQGRDGWIKAAETVETNTKITAAALAKKNADEMVFTDGDMMAGCTTCHQQFRFKTPATATEPAH